MRRMCGAHAMLAMVRSGAWRSSVMPPSGGANASATSPADDESVRARVSWVAARAPRYVATAATRPKYLLATINNESRELNEYRLTDKGRALLPIIDHMRSYGEQWLGGEAGTGVCAESLSSAAALAAV